ncbi:MAG: DUF2087 domain-containing protein [Myxococcota bacterium]
MDGISELLAQARDVCGARHPRVDTVVRLMCTLPRAASIQEQRAGVGVLWSYLRASLSPATFDHCARRAAVRVALAPWWKALHRELDAQGRLRAWPSKQQGKRAALDLLARRLDRSAVYHEREITALLSRWHTFGDPALLRRELYDRGLVERSRDGRAYWLRTAQEGPPSSSG